MTLRLILLLGMVVHKLVWELMKRQSKEPSPRRPISAAPGKTVVKYLKAAILAFLIVQTLFLDVLPISHEPFVLQLVGSPIYGLGLAISVIARLQLGRNWANIEDFQVMPEQSLVQKGIYGYIRHPIYTGDILLLIGLELALNSWLVLGTAIPIVIVIKQALAEESLLSRSFSGYADYRRQTKRFIPFVI